MKNTRASTLPVVGVTCLGAVVVGSAVWIADVIGITFRWLSGRNAFLLMMGGFLVAQGIALLHVTLFPGPGRREKWQWVHLLMLPFRMFAAFEYLLSGGRRATRTGSSRTLVAVLPVAALSAHLRAGESPLPLPVPLSKPGVCQREGSAIVGRMPEKISPKIRAPRKTRSASPKYPEFPPGTTGRGVWVGEALVDSQGKVVRVWTIREVEITPPLPAFNKAIVDAFRLWKFDPLLIDNEPRPFCVTITTNVNWS